MTFGSEADEATSFALMDAYAKAGGNFLDTADGLYGRRLRAGRRALAQGAADRGQQMVVATKGRFPMGDGPNDLGLFAPAFGRGARRVAAAAGDRADRTSTRCTPGMR